MSDARDESDQPQPTPNERPFIIDLIEPMLPPMLRPLFRERAEVGRARYGTLLQAFNGRDALRDALDEFIDGPKYIRQAIEEESDPIEQLVLWELLAHALQLAERVRSAMERRDARRSAVRCHTAIEERAAIVAWLRALPHQKAAWSGEPSVFESIADEIEEGEHVRSEPEPG